MKKESVWMALVTNEGEVVFAKVCQTKQKSKKSIVDYLCENEAFESKSFDDACWWIGEKDLRLDLMVFEMETKDFDSIQLSAGLVIKPPPKEKGKGFVFRVVYTIDVDAPDEVMAAEKAWNMMCSKDSDPILIVINLEGKQTRLNMSHLLKFNKISIGFVVQKFRKDNNDKFRCIHQEFIAGDDVQFENTKGESIGTPEHAYQQFNMTLISSSQIIVRLGDVLASIKVGGEQSRQFAHEIKILDELLRDLGCTRQE